MRFKASIVQSIRNNGNAFEKGDAISVFAVRPSSNINFDAEGNYANNVKYVYSASLFTSNTPIQFDETSVSGLAYFAIYPYSTKVSNQYAFEVKDDQSVYANYTMSDLCIAYSEPTAQEVVTLKFNHRLSNIIVKFRGDEVENNSLGVEINDVYVSCDVDIKANTYKTKGRKQNVVMGEEADGGFHAIIVPQSVSANDAFMTITMNGREIPLSLLRNTAFESGYKYVYELELNGDKANIVDCLIIPWNTDWINQELYTSSNYEDKGYHDYDSLFYKWTGLGVKSVQYDLFATSALSGVSDEEIVASLRGKVDSEDLQKINNGGVVYVTSGLKSSTNYTLCTLVTYNNGDVQFIKSSCTTKATNESKNEFAQQLYVTSDYEDRGYHDYDSLFYSWTGVNVKRVQYRLFTTESLSGMDDTDIKEYLTKEVDAEHIGDINDGGVIYVTSGLESETSYTLCALATYEDGATEFVKSTCSTGTAPSVNSFSQQLYTSKDYEESGYHDYDSLFYSWVGSGVKRVQYMLFKTESLAGVGDDVIKEYLAIECDADGIYSINNGGITYVYYGLEGETSYTLCTLVTYEDDSTEFVKSICTTAASLYENRFSQSLFTSDKYEDRGLYVYNSLFATWMGGNASSVKYKLFKSESIAGLSDGEIIGYLSNSLDGDAIGRINGNGLTYYFSSLASETSYTLCTYVTFNNGETALYKTSCSTGAEPPTDPRLPQIVPEEILDKLEEHDVPIYNGVTPPNVEGSYYVDPFVTVYCEDYGYGGYETGFVIASQYIQFYNINTKDNTLDYYGFSTTGHCETGAGAFVSGCGNNFTVFFNTIGETYGVCHKTALLISGTKTSSGIKDFYYAFVMVEKGADPDNVIMKEGIFRVFKDQDGMSYSTTRASVVYDDCEHSMVGVLK